MKSGQRVKYSEDFLNLYKCFAKGKGKLGRLGKVYTIEEAEERRGVVVTSDSHGTIVEWDDERIGYVFRENLQEVV